VIFLGIMNKNFAYYMWKSIPRKYVKDLISRVIQGLILMVCIFSSIKYFPLVFVSLISNLTPLLTALLSFILFKKGLSGLDTTILIVSFIGVTVLITGTPSKTTVDMEENSQEKPSDKGERNMIIGTIMLVLIPILSSSVVLFIHHLKSLSEISVSAILTFAILVIYGPLLLFTDGYRIILDFDSNDWIISILLGLSSSVVQISKNKALQYEEPAKLAVLMYFQSVIQLILDVLFLNTQFTGQ
jgi:drug/metabolite transporter (DMT)-like permease